MQAEKLQLLSGTSLTPSALPILDTNGRVLVSFAIEHKQLTFGKLLGEGGYGKVYLGAHPRHGEVAIKVIDGLELNPAVQQKVREEASVMVGIRSRHLVEFRGICFTPQCCLVMEYLPNGNLFRLLNNGRTLSWRDRFRIAADTALGLQHLHEANVLHRDIKSLNILLDRDSRAKLCDFGLATLKASSTLSDPKGTVAWMAPEILEGGDPTKAADIYGLGMVFWELATRRLPYQKAGRAAVGWIMKGIQEEILESDKCPEKFAQIIRACWQKDPAKRPTASVIAEQLAVLYQAEPAPEPLEAMPYQPNLSSFSSGPLRPLEGGLLTSQNSAPLTPLSGPLLTMGITTAGTGSSSTLSTPLVDSQSLSSAPNMALFRSLQDKDDSKQNSELEKLQQQLATQKQQLETLQSQLQTLNQSESSVLSLTQRQEKEKLLQLIETHDSQMIVLVQQIKKVEEALLSSYQRPLIEACENGNLAAVKQALLQGAHPLQPDVNGKQALPAAIWGINKDVIAYLKNRLGSEAPSWDVCVAHNKKHYGQTFYVPDEFDLSLRSETKSSGEPVNAEENCIRWLSEQKLQINETRLSSIGIPLQEITELQPTGEFEQKEVKACRSICGDPVHYNDEKNGYQRHGMSLWHECDAEGCILLEPCLVVPGLSCFLYLLCCATECDEGAPPQVAAQGKQNLITMTTAHAVCCTLPYVCFPTTATVSIPIKKPVVINKQVTSPSTAAQTLFGEIATIRKMQGQSATFPQKQSLLAPGPTQMQMQ